MSQPDWIELQCGPSPAFTLGLWVLWLLAAAAGLSVWQHYRWPWLLAAGIALVLIHPGSGLPLHCRLKLRIHSDGSARLGEVAGTWHTVWRANRLAMLFSVSLAGKTHRVLVCAALNRPDDYRHLLVWSRYVPYGTGRARGVSE